MLTFMHLQHLTNPPGLAPGPGYSHVVTGSGRLVVISGQVALDEAGQLVGGQDTADQAEQVFANLARALDAADATFADVVKLTYFLRDVAALPAVRAVRDRYVDTANPPASSAVQVAALAGPEFLIEVEAMALVAPER